MKWKLPKTFKVSKIKKGQRERHDGEPRFLVLTKHVNDRSVTTEETIKCCGCGLVHLHTYNVFKEKNKWYLGIRAYRL